MRLRSKILAFALPLTLIPFVLTAFAVYYFVIRSYQNQIVEEQNRLLAEAIVNIRREQETARIDVALIANLPPIAEYLEAVSQQTPGPLTKLPAKEMAMRAILQLFLDGHPYYLQLSLVDTQGQERVKFSKLTGPQQSLRSIKDEEFFRRILIAGGMNPATQLPAEPVQPERFVSTFTYRVRREQFAGVAILHLNTAVFERALRPLLASQRLSTFLFDDRGLVFAKSFAGLEEESCQKQLKLAAEAAALLTQPALVIPQREVSEGNRQYLFSVLPAEEFIGFIEPVAGENWFLGVLQPKEMVLEHARTLRLIFLITLTGALGAVIWGTTRYSRRLTQPLEQMAEATTKIARGQFEIGLKVSTGDEVEELAIAVKRMADDLNNYQTELIKSAKLAAVGEMTSEISHEIQNRISGLSLWIQYLDAEVEPGDPRREYLDEMKQGLQSFTGLLNSLKQVYKTPILKLEEADLNQVVKQALSYIEQRIVDRKLEVELRLIPGPLQLCCDVDKITSVILNLFINAAEAIEEGGRILVQTSDFKPESLEVSPSAGQVEERVVKLSVTDNGCGISEQDLPRIFYPFYSTKAGGSGLGLAIASNFVSAHGGKIEVESRVGQGTTFTVILQNPKVCNGEDPTAG
ncbi:MAG TPA: sensor histidine kinase [Pyrinomonadaceae bacterium]|nr:sensor histidine kinase [Pyrinomonadaceae bacterium]